MGSAGEGPGWELAGDHLSPVFRFSLLLALFLHPWSLIRRFRLAPGCLCLWDTICKRGVKTPHGWELNCSASCFLSWSFWLEPERILFGKIVQKRPTVRRNSTFQGPTLSFPGRREKGFGWSLPTVSWETHQPRTVPPKETARKTFYRNSQGQWRLWYSVHSPHGFPFSKPFRAGRSLV